MRRTALLGAGLVVSAVFAYVAVRDARPGEVARALDDAQLLWLPPVLALLALAFLLRAVRWQTLFAPGRRPPLGDVSRALFVGYLFNAVLPLRAGEAARVVALRKRGDASLAETAATAVVERAFDVLSLLLLLFVLLPWLPELTWAAPAGVLAGILIAGLAAAVAALAVASDRLIAAALRALAWLPGLSEERLAGPVASAHRGLAGLRGARTGAAAFGWTTLSWLVVGAAYWLLAYAFQIDVSPLAGLLIVIAIGLAMILPSSPAALGVFEGATVLALAAYGIDDSRALSYALVLHALSIVPFLVLAPPVLAGYRGGAARSPAPSSGTPVRT